MGTGYVTIKSAADILNISTETLRNWDKSGRLKAKRDKNGYRIYNITELEHFAVQNGLRRKKGRFGLTKD